MGIFFSRSETSEKEDDVNRIRRSVARFYVKKTVGRNHWFNWFVGGKTRTLLRKRNRTRRLY